MTQPVDPFRSRFPGFSPAFLRVWGALPDRGWQSVGENAAASGVPRGSAKGILEKIANAGQAEENDDRFPRRYRRRTRNELNKDEREYRSRIERAIASP